MTLVSTNKIHNREYLYATYDFGNQGDGQQQLGKGKHGHVRLAYDPVFKRDVAIKSQPVWTNLASREELLLRSLQAKNMPHVLRLFDVAETRWRRYLVMERSDAMAGPKLGRVAYALRCFSGLRYAIHVEHLDLKLAASITAEVIRRLMELHAVGVYHRDVKLQNVGRQGYKLLDYGKNVSNASCVLRPVYEWCDARGVCRMFCDMLRQVDPEKASEFEHWYKGVGHLRIEELRSHPFLSDEFDVPPQDPHQSFAAYAWHRALWPMMCSVEWLTAKASQLAPQTLPGQPQAVDLVRDGGGGDAPMRAAPTPPS